MESKQLFEQVYLNVVCNGEPEVMPWEELFGNGSFTSVKAVSYVSSPRFLSKFLSLFNTAEVIVGIDSPKPLRAIDAFMRGGNVRFYNGLTDSVRDSIEDGSMSLRYSNMQSAIHSKVYLLSNEQGRTRLVVGSINLTENALCQTGKRQFEEALAFDDSPLYDLFEKRYFDIRQQTVDMVPTVAKEKWRLDRELLDISNDRSLAGEVLLQEILQNPAVGQIFQASKAEFEEVQQAVESGDSDVSQYDLDLYEFTRNIKKRSKASFVLKDRDGLEKAMAKLDLKTIAVEAELEPEPRFETMFLAADYSSGYTRLIERQRSSDGQPTGLGLPYAGEPLTSNEIAQELANIEELIATYAKHTVNTVGREYLSWLYEAILYTYTAPFIRDIRGYVASKDADLLKYIPIYMALGGVSDSGKTHLLGYLYKSLAGSAFSSDACDYEVLTRSGGYKRNLAEAFSTGNRFPLFVDEVADAMWKNKAGAAIIKSKTNTLAFDVEYAPVICTTNSPTYAPETGVNTRVKYLDLNAAFDRNNFEGEQAYQRALAGCTGLLARDFSVRFAQRFAEEPMLGFQGHDYLHLTRVIFREYYAEAGMDVPNYFPEEVQDLGAVNCRKLWVATWSDPNKRSFFVDAGDGTIRVELEQLFKHNPGARGKAEYVNGVPGRVLLGNTGKYLEFDKPEFFKWLKIDQPKSFAERVRDWLK